MSLIAFRPGVTQCVDGRPTSGGRAAWLARWLLPAAVAVAAVPVLAAGGDGQAVPAQTYASKEAAQAAADVAKAESDRIRRQYDADAAACMHKFFATRCAEKARLERNAGVTRTDADRREAELYIRREEARERQEKRDRDNAERDAKAADRTARKAEEQASRPPPKAEPAAPARPSGPVAAPAPRPPRELDDPAVRARNRAEFERKQAEAREYAEKQARDRQEAEAKRARRRADREEEVGRLKAQQQEAGAQAPAGNP